MKEKIIVKDHLTFYGVVFKSFSILEEEIKEISFARNQEEQEEYSNTDIIVDCVYNFTNSLDIQIERCILFSIVSSLYSSDEKLMKQIYLEEMKEDTIEESFKELIRSYIYYVLKDKLIKKITKDL